jgi:glycosyltransferase involved in cell wall biosynthesis
VRILVVSNLYPPHVLGGYEILCAQVVDRLRARGHEVRVLTSAHGEPLEEAGIERALVLETPFDRPARRSRRRRLEVPRTNAAVAREAIRRLDPDRVFVWSQLRLSIGAAAAAEASRRPVAYALNDEHLAGYAPVPPGLRPRRLAGWLLDRVVLRGLTLASLRLRHAACISAALKRNLVARGVPVETARVIHQGIPIESFPPRLDRGPSRGPLRLLYAGQLHDYKGVHTLLEATALVAGRRGRDAVTVTIAGDGPSAYVERLRRLAARSGVPSDFLGRRPHLELPALYRGHDAFVFPSTWEEPFGLTHLEAMASGTPVISTTRGGPGEFLEHGDNALVFDAGDAGDLASRIEALVDQPDLRARLGLAGRETVERRFSLDRYVADLERFLEEAA